jgi:hypothetical protein
MQQYRIEALYDHHNALKEKGGLTLLTRKMADPIPYLSKEV